MPKTQHLDNVKSYYAEGAISAFTVVVEGTADGQVKAPGDADAGAIVGIALHDAAAGERVKVARPGDSAPVKAGAAIARGALVSIHGTTGKVKTAAPAAGANAFVVGQAQNAAAADGDIIYCLIMPSVLQGAA